MPRLVLPALVASALLVGAAAPWAAEARPGLTPCRLPGVEHGAWCGVVKRPLDPSAPGGVHIDVHFAVLPALARNRKPDPVLFFAGGPGQSAIELGGTVAQLLARLAYRRDIVLIDQRGTGRSAPLHCAEVPATAPLAPGIEPDAQLSRLQSCLGQLKTLEHGDLRHYTTTLAMQDAEAVRLALGAAQLNLVGGSYGTRAALEYLRQFPRAVRRVVIDGVAPPDMGLPAAMSTDNQAAFDAMLAACRSQKACAQRYPTLAQDWQALLATLPRVVTVSHPFTGALERVTLTREGLLTLVRVPLYAPALAAALPQALDEAAHDRFAPLLGLAAALGGGASRLSEGMHYSVVCSEDLPSLDRAVDAPGRDFGSTVAAQYRRVCADWPRGAVPPAFYRIPPAPAATLVLSGGADPATPARHGERVARALGALARHVVVPEAGHGVMGLPCMRDVLFRFVDAESDERALAVDAGCALGIPRPPVFAPFSTSATQASP